MPSGIDAITGRSIYGTAPGPSTAQLGAASNPYGSQQITSSVNPVNQAIKAGAGSSPIAWLFLLIVFLVGLMFLAQRIGSEKDTFANVKLSAYNIIVLTIALIIGLNVAKTLAVKLQNTTGFRGLASVVLAA